MSRGSTPSLARRKPGLRVTEHIQLVRELGQGAMGSVWVADHLTLETQVAVKFISRKLLGDDDEEIRERFRREATSAARIKSPHIVQIFDHGLMQDGTPYIVMELLEGESLADRLERTGWLSIEQCVRVVLHTGRGLAKAHSLGIVHRDIKPENIFLCPTDEGPFVKLLDFGIAKHGGMPVASSLTTPGVLIGTAEYMSREQVVSAREVDHRADLWALAVVAYEVLTGDVPFTGETMGAICASIVRGEYPPPSALRKGCPRSVDAFFAKAFAFEPSARFESARELAFAFRDALGVDLSLRPSDEVIAPRRATATDVGLGGDSRQTPTVAGTAAGTSAPPPSVSPGASSIPPPEDPVVFEGPASDLEPILPEQAAPLFQPDDTSGPTLGLERASLEPAVVPARRRAGLWVVTAAAVLGIGAALLLGATPEPVETAAGIPLPAVSPPKEPVASPQPAGEPADPTPADVAADPVPDPPAVPLPDPPAASGRPRTAEPHTTEEHADESNDPQRPDYGF